MSNYIAVYGPSGPLYLLKTNKDNQWWVINGNWLLVKDEIPIPDLQKYVIITDDFDAYSYQQACSIIENLYTQGLPYKVLHTDNLLPFNPDCNDTAHYRAQDNYNSFPNTIMPDAVTADMVIDYKLSIPTIDLDMGGSVTPEENTPLGDLPNVLEEKAKQLCKHFEIDCNEVEMRICKELISRGYKPESLMPTLIAPPINTKIVTTKTVHFVNDQDVKSMTSDQLINNMAQLEDSIEKLNEIKTKSKFINKTVKEQEATLKVVVKHLDARK